MHDVVRVINEERKRQGLSKEELAKRAGFGASTIRNWELGSEPSLVKVDSALRVLGINYTLGQSLDCIPTRELIDELNRRDLFAELDEEKRDWLLENGFRQITKYQFMDANRAMLYSLERLQNSSLEENQKKYLVAKSIRESLLQPCTPSEPTIARQPDEEPEHPRPKGKSHHPQNRCEPNHLYEEKCKDFQVDRKSAPEKEA